MIEQLPFIFFILLVLWGVFGQLVVKSAVLNSFIYALMFSLAIHAPYISYPITKGWEWIEAMPWSFFLIFMVQKEIIGYVDKRFQALDEYLEDKKNEH